MLKNKRVTKLGFRASPVAAAPKFRLKAPAVKTTGLRVTLSKNLTLHFIQYSKVFTALKRGLKDLKLDKVRFQMDQFRLVPVTKHAVKARMGKGKSRLDSYA